MTLRELRTEYEAVRIGPQIWRLVREMTAGIARRYPPSVYNDGAPWSKDSIEDLAQQVVLDRLLGEAQLEYLFDQATSIESWRRLAALQIRRTLSHRRRKTVVDRLLTRVRKLAQTPPFRMHTRGTAVWFSHGDSAVSFADLNDSRISRIAYSLRDIPQLMANPQSSRAPMVYTTPDVRLLLERVLGEVSVVSERDLARVLEVLLTSWLPTFLRHAEREYPSDEPNPEAVVEDAEMRSVIQDFVGSLSETERWILLSKSQRIADREIAARFGRSRPWVAERKRRVLERLGTELMPSFEGRLRRPAMGYLLALISDSQQDADQ